MGQARLFQMPRGCGHISLPRFGDGKETLALGSRAVVDFRIFRAVAEQREPFFDAP